MCIQKIYGFHGINHQNIVKSLYVTPVTKDGRTEESGKYCVLLDQKPQLFQKVLVIKGISNIERTPWEVTCSCCIDLKRSYLEL